MTKPEGLTEKASGVLLVLAEGFILFCALIVAISFAKALALAYLRLLELYLAHPDASQVVVFVIAVTIAVWFEFYRKDWRLVEGV
jgi:hypothetical protein